MHLATLFIYTASVRNNLGVIKGGEYSMKIRFTERQSFIAFSISGVAAYLVTLYFLNF